MGGGGRGVGAGGGWWVGWGGQPRGDLEKIQCPCAPKLHGSTGKDDEIKVAYRRTYNNRGLMSWSAARGTGGPSMSERPKNIACEPNHNVLRDGPNRKNRDQKLYKFLVVASECDWQRHSPRTTVNRLLLIRYRIRQLHTFGKQKVRALFSEPTFFVPDFVFLHSSPRRAPHRAPPTPPHPVLGLF